MLFLPWSSGASSGAILDALLASIPTATPVFVPSALSPGRSPTTKLRFLAPSREGAGAALNAVAQACPQADLVVIADHVKLPDGWLRRLGAAAHADDTVAAGTALAVGPGRPLFDELADLSVATSATPGPPIHPRVLNIWPHCAWIRRSALELVGDFDSSLTHPTTALGDFAARAAVCGLACALADDLCVERREPRLSPCPSAELNTLRRRYPWLQDAERDQFALDPGPLRRSVVAARIAGSAISVTVDARSLGPRVGGTQTYVAALVLALARSRDLRVRALVATDAPRVVTDAFARAGAETVTYEQAVAGVPRSDVVHRPQQVFTADDLRLLQLVGDRIVVSQMDLISYRNPTYHATINDWREYRRATRLGLAIADQTVFFSEHGRREAIAEELVEPARAAVVGIGVDVPFSDEELRRPEGVPTDRGLLLMLGADYAHKNRPFALELVDELRRRHGWDGLLVFAGPHQPHGSSANLEAEVVRVRPGLSDHTLDLGRVTEPEKRWLVTMCQAQICASGYEGFGLIPLESAAAGRPCIYAPVTSLGEIVDRAAATITPWDAAASADAAIRLLRDGEPRRNHLSLLSAALERCRWDDVVDQLTSCYRTALGSPYHGAAARAWEELELLSGLMTLQDRVRYGQALIDTREGMLTRAQQRGLMRVASRPLLRAALLAPFSVLGADERERN